MTKIDIISGFLGAGKTTLIKKLLEEALAGQKIVLIENEFGEIGIDGGFLKESGIQINEMNSGCICCSLVGDFHVALKEVLEKFTPDRILIEPSGVGKLSDVIKAVQNVVDDETVVLNSHITVADAMRAKMYLKNFGEFYKNQVEFASAIILSRTQNVKEDKLDKVVELLREINDKSPIVTTPWDELTGEQLLSVMEGENDFAAELLEAAQICPECGHHHHEGECCDHEHHHHAHEDHEHHHEHHHDHEEHGHHHHHHHGHDHHHADEIFTSWGRETPRKYSEEKIRQILSVLAKEEDNEYGVILRAKGIVPEENGKWIHFDLVPGEEELRYGTADYTGRICVIGAELKEDKLAELFGL
ncbi:MAG: GTP-binding protein [Eubacterium sp.]|nr:GTP-binding protein [Eubacterium sp.]